MEDQYCSTQKEADEMLIEVKLGRMSIDVLEKKQKSKAILPFCPLIRTGCDDRCVCFQEVWIQKINLSRFRVHPSCCTNAMFFNE